MFIAIILLPLTIIIIVMSCVRNFDNSLQTTNISYTYTDTDLNLNSNLNNIMII